MMNGKNVCQCFHLIAFVWFNRFRNGEVADYAGSQHAHTLI